MMVPLTENLTSEEKGWCTTGSAFHGAESRAGEISDGAPRLLSKTIDSRCGSENNRTRFVVVVSTKFGEAS